MKQSRLTDGQKQAFLDMFLDLVQIESASDEDQLGKCSPTTDGQLKVVKYLEPILKKMGLEGVEIDENGYLTGTLPSNLDLPADPIPTVGLVAHADTNPEGKAKDGSAPNPKVITYEGGDIQLGNSGEIITMADNPHLANLVGKQLVVTDGKSLLGGDDKAGIVEIVFMLQYLINHPEIKRPHIRVAIVADEEISGQVRHLTKTLAEGAEGHEEETVTILDRNKWDVDQAYTVDGGELGEYNVETFNAVTATVTISGKLAHPAEAKKKRLINACTLTSYFLHMLGETLPPCEHSEGRHPHTTVLKMAGDMTQMKVGIILRGFEQSEIDDQKEKIRDICFRLGAAYIGTNVGVEFEDSYRNMAVYLSERPIIEKLLNKAIELQGITPIKEAIRGGTDGSRLSELGCPCPNIFTGTMNMHAKTEHLVLSWAYQSVEVLINLMELWADAVTPRQALTA